MNMVREKKKGKKLDRPMLLTDAHDEYRTKKTPSLVRTKKYKITIGLKKDPLMIAREPHQSAKCLPSLGNEALFNHNTDSLMIKRFCLVIL